VLLGFLQTYGVDYKEVFSPTIRGEQIRLMVSVGAKMKGMRSRKGIKVIVLSKGDVTSAYTTTPIPKGEEVMFELPQGNKPKNKMAAPKGYKVVGLSLKAQQGMKQSGRLWNRHQHKCLLAQGFEQSEVAPCIYIKKVGDGYILGGHLCRRHPVHQRDRR
jgi:hypothetical protein